MTRTTLPSLRISANSDGSSARVLSTRASKMLRSMAHLLRLAVSRALYGLQWQETRHRFDSLSCA